MDIAKVIGEKISLGRMLVTGRAIITAVWVLLLLLLAATSVWKA